MAETKEKLLAAVAAAERYRCECLGAAESALTVAVQLLDEAKAAARGWVRQSEIESTIRETHRRWLDS